MSFWDRAWEWASGTPVLEAGHGGMYLALVITPMPSAMAEASPAVCSCQWAAPTWPGLWHDAQLCSRIGWMSAAKEGPPECFCTVGAEITVGTVNLDGFRAESSRLRSTSSEVLTRPAIEIGTDAVGRHLHLGGGCDAELSAGELGPDAPRHQAPSCPSP